jgi:hypothetical protein
MRGELVFDGSKEQDLGGHVGEGDAGVLAIKLEGSPGRGQLLMGTIGLLEAVRGSAEDPGEAGFARLD